MPPTPDPPSKPLSGVQSKIPPKISKPAPETSARPVTDHRTWTQETIDSLLNDPRAVPLRSAVFVVVDLETTGGPADECGITEIGAVKVCGGESLGEFSTLVNPDAPIPPFVTVLTGITQAMVTPAPKLPEVLPAFLEFARGAVLVAHNAAYDIGFLKAACARHGYPWPRPLVLDTVALSRRALTRDEVPNHRLGTLARVLGARAPSHRALDDARATVDVLHALFARLGAHRVGTVGEAIEFTRAVSPAQRRNRHLAQGLPDAPGVYVFRAADDRPLYVGTSISIATRVRSYFTAAEKRGRIKEMLAAADRVDAIECAHALEAQVRELRLIAAHKPPYNRRSKFPERTHWVKLTAEPYPRLSVVRKVADDGAAYLGPFSSIRAANAVVAAAHDALPLRQCTQRLSPSRVSPACALAEMGRCLAPCQLRIDVDDYARVAAQPFRAATRDEVDPLVDRLSARIDEMASAQRYEEAAVLRGRLGVLLRASIRMQRLAALSSIAQLVAARPAPGGGWELAVIRHGRLTGAATSPPRVHPQPTIDAMVATAETVIPGPGPTPCASAEETERVLDWLEAADTRLVQISQGWSLPARGAGRYRELLIRVERSATHPYVHHQSPDRTGLGSLG